MPNKSSDPVFQLIKSLTQSEKRHFRLFANRQGSTEGLKFLQLFDAFDAQEQHDEERVLTQVPTLKRAQLANLKANLYTVEVASCQDLLEEVTKLWYTLQQDPKLDKIQGEVQRKQKDLDSINTVMKDLLLRK